MEEQFNTIAENLKQSMDSLMTLQAKMFADMPEECKEKIIPIQADINEAINCIKSGDLLKINEISQKYARYSDK